MIRRNRPPEFEILNECIECGEPGPQPEWLEFNVEVKQGIRAQHVGLTPTYITELLLCKTCLFLDKYEGLREVFDHHTAVHGLPDYDTNCVVICHHGPPTAGLPIRPNKRKISCPVCWKYKARVWLSNEKIPLPAVANWWNTVTTKKTKDEVAAEAANEIAQ
jgi:hypothetical protein